MTQIAAHVLDRSGRRNRAIGAPRVHTAGERSQVDDRISVAVCERPRDGHWVAAVLARGCPALSRTRGIAYSRAGWVPWGRSNPIAAWAGPAG